MGLPQLALIAAPPALLVILALAIHQDLLRQRIPNALSFGALATGLALATISAGPAGLGNAALGAVVGFGAFLPFYIARGMGAGDVKLMAAAGSFLGPSSALFAAAGTLVVGALLAIGYLAWGRLHPPSNFERAAAATTGATIRPSAGTLRRHRFPYATAIGAGVFAAMLHGDALLPLIQLTGGGR